MMLRGEILDVGQDNVVYVKIPQKYGNDSVKAVTRISVSKGDLVYVTDTSVSRVPQWVVFDQMHSVGSWGSPYPHEHPIGQVDGLKDWLTQYETWVGDHQAKLDEAEKRIAEGKVEVDAARADLDQAESDLAEAVRKATLEQARLDQAEANLDQMGRNLTAAGGRISANETALGKAQDRLTSAETTVQKTSTDLTALQGTVGDVQSKVTASDQKALEALNKAGAAQASADGKNRITRATSPAAQPGTAVGDTHFTMSSMGGGGVVTRQQRWDGSTWQDETVSHEVIASLDLGKATVGELDGGRIAARSLSADRLQIGVAGNLIVDPKFNDPQLSGWRLNGRWQWADAAGEKCFRAWADGTLTTMALNGGKSQTPSTPVSAGVTYALTLDMKGIVQVYLTIRYANGTVRTPGVTIQATAYSSARRNETFVFTPDTYDHAAAEGTKPMEILINIRQPSNAPVSSETAVYAARFAPRTSSVLIEDGAVTAEKVQAQSVAGAVGRFLTVEAMTGVFTESLTATDATLLGKTVAKSLTVEKLTGRDAILTGTVDVSQLNVTGEMAGTIARFMDLQARRAIFTEGMTANESTLLGTTVAEAINAGTVASRIMTGGLLQTTAAANRGVKIDNSGIRAWDGSGRQTMNINGTSNYLTGEFSTASSGQRVKISNNSSIAAVDLYASRSTDDHVGIWYDSPDTNVLNAVGRVLAIAESSYSRNSPGLEMWPMRGTFGFRGRWQQETDATKFVEIFNNNGLAAGAWVQLEIPFQSPFPTNNSLLFPLVSVERVYGGDVVVMVRAITASSITLVAVNKATSGTSGAIKLRAVTFNLNA